MLGRITKKPQLISPGPFGFMHCLVRTPEQERWAFTVARAQRNAQAGRHAHRGATDQWDGAAQALQHAFQCVTYPMFGHIV